MRSLAATSFATIDDLGEGLVRELGVEAEPEAGRALADIGGVGGNVGIVAEDALGLPGRVRRDADGGAFGEAELEEQLGPLGQREELLGDVAEGDDGGDEDADGGENGGEAEADAGPDDPAQGAIKAGVVRVVGRLPSAVHGRLGPSKSRHPRPERKRRAEDPRGVGVAGAGPGFSGEGSSALAFGSAEDDGCGASMARERPRQQLHAEIRREDHRHEPRRHQRDRRPPRRCRRRTRRPTSWRSRRGGSPPP
jgi:hypothetical protein